MVVLTDTPCRFSYRVRFVYMYSGPAYGPVVVVVVVDKGSVSQNQKSQVSSLPVEFSGIYDAFGKLIPGLLLVCSMHFWGL